MVWKLARAGTAARSSSGIATMAMMWMSS
jgi:hypothetical protein